ncbi:MAG: DUF2947 domain-containing protein [Proteobacteria bacterium]|nr:DUF2947 domain-containing protein [Pseudomonadota bacterium]
MIPLNSIYSDFDLIWRFSDAEKYVQLSEAEFRRFHPIPSDESIKLWNEYVYPSNNSREHHLTELYVQKNIKWPDGPTFKTDDDVVEKEIASLLRKSFPLPDNTTVYFFWHAETCVKTDWGLFLSYWDDFCYPSDDSDVIVIPEFDKAIIYIEDRWHFLPKALGKTIFQHQENV